MEIKRVIFEPMEFQNWVLRVIIIGEGLEERAIPVVAKVGDQQVEALMPLFGSEGVVGFLQTIPPDGAPVSVGFADSPLQTTDFTFQSESIS